MLKCRHARRPPPPVSLLFLAALLGLGLLLGSFLNVVIHRLPQTRAAGLRADARHSLAFLAWPMSFCPHCQTPIPPWRNVPLLSYALLRGRAACCGARIPPQYPLVEAGGALAVFAAFWHAATLTDALFIVAFLSLLLAAAAIDLRRYCLLDILTLPLLWLGLLANLDGRFALLPNAVLGAAGGYVGLAAFAVVVSFAIKKEAMGMGDFKLFAALGAWLGWQALPFTLFLAALLGLLFAAAHRLLRGRGRGRRFAFGPCLALAGAVFLLWGQELSVAYWRFVGG